MLNSYYGYIDICILQKKYISLHQLDIKLRKHGERRKQNL